jgi:hypothetical protein
MKNRKDIIRAIEIVTDSFVSHIPYLNKGQQETSNSQRSTPTFEKKAELEYLEVLRTLLELLWMKTAFA